MFSRAIMRAIFQSDRKIFLRFFVGKPPSCRYSGEKRILHVGVRRVGERMSVWEPFLIEWGSILLRWLHVTAAIAWIGGSFFFMHLDASLRKLADQKPGVSGVSWQVHGGGFYEMSKYVARARRAARSPHLAQMAVVLDLDVGLQPALLGLLRTGELFSHRPRGHGFAAVAGGADRRLSRSRSAGSFTISCANRRSPTTTRCWRSSASASWC